jgi:ATP-dependent Clp protease ATP-binding subunit ClpB
LKNKLAKNDIDISFDDAAVSLIAQKGYKPEYGGRPVKRAIKELVVDALSLAMLRQEVTKTAPILVSAIDYQIAIRNR